MIQAQCSGCGTTYSFQPAATPQSIQCAACNTTVNAPATAQPVTSPSPSGVPQAQPAGQTPFARPVAPAGQAAVPMATPAAVIGAAPTANPVSQTAATTPPHLAKPPTLPQKREASADDGKPDDEGEPTRIMPTPSGGRGVLWTLAGAVFVLLLVGGGAALYFARPDLFRRESETTIEESERSSGGKFEGASAWIKVGNKNEGQRIGEIKLLVERLEYGEVLAKDAAGRVQNSGQKFLQIYLHVENVGGAEVEYVSWYGTPFVTESGGQAIARLTDNTGRVYHMMTFGDVDKIKGHVPRAILKTSNAGDDRKFVDDVVIFEVAEGVDLLSVEYFQLELPAEAHGRRGKYRLQIPRSRLVDGDAPN